MRHTDQHPMTRTHTGYTRPQHTRDHWQGNRPDDCAWCERETTPNPDTTRRPVQDDQYPGALAAALICVPAVLTALFAVLALIHGMAGAWINGWTALAILTAAVTAVIGALIDRSNP